MMVFICMNEEQNAEQAMDKAINYARLVHKMGHVPCIVQVLLRLWEREPERRRALCEEAIACCDEVWSFELPDVEAHSLMRFARMLRMPVCNATAGGRRDYVFNRDMVRAGR